MWDDLRKQVDFERQQLRRLLEGQRPLLLRSAVNPPSESDLFALAAILHSFYNGVENIFKRATLEIEGSMPAGEFWHKALLDSMAQSTDRRAALITPELQNRLKEFMEFRHVFRHAYVFNLRWDKMEPLVRACEDTLILLENALDRFFGPSAP